MISPQQVEEMIKAELPDAQVQVQDLTGGGDPLSSNSSFIALCR
ncbi:hypothetical protein NSTCB13_03548 [Nostoc sp. DSM 114160]|jgi:hypothetical protein